MKDIGKKIEQLNVTDNKEKKALKKKHRDTTRNATGSRQGKSRIPVAKAVSPVTSHSSSTTKECPKCGAAMTLKAGRNGKFYGCGGFPVCRYTEKG
ncbi:topoisomerase DNA-binding C4 zinc finger domain-containing protein [Sporosarcina thermotolerans]|uniref:Topoisomerase DNA-binding C4 zinc finger domain-containing protein n=1 Tax=Sporosarcina thermotolerans TaxID=633404 RepID=A0AAW9AHR4_9BACL|nr:topoisomerase DNA-binding C4 zinc finger domain-containing protein [Sporosarcina thermotolerans]MDW0118601.1 topoisomerase DNA-binding C4 zinc finger domain-containing protein [Sporosarcina thermotolerans]WHT49608.1 topoisomerase DNA-binding C4 zinc finger domain-containing protein [Sporosarcina thermotolerans]